MIPMKYGMILAAGFGTRARPLTQVRHKALFPVLNRPLLHYNVKLLESLGIRNILINVHHLADQVIEEAGDITSESIIHPIREDNILGTGGGMKNLAAHLTQETLVVVNGAIITQPDLSAVVLAHEESGAMATLVLFNRPRFNIVMVGQDGLIQGFRGRWRPERPGESRRLLGFTGIHILDIEVLDHVPEGPADIIEVYQQLIESGRPVRAYVIEDLPWWKVETIPDYLGIHSEFLENCPNGRVIQGPNVRIEPGAEIQGWAALGRDVIVEAGATILNAVLWPGSRVKAGIRVVNSVLADGVTASEDLIGDVKIS